MCGIATVNRRGDECSHPMDVRVVESKFERAGVLNSLADIGAYSSLTYNQVSNREWPPIIWSSPLWHFGILVVPSGRQEEDVISYKAEISGSRDRDHSALGQWQRPSCSATCRWKHGPSRAVIGKITGGVVTKSLHDSRKRSISGWILWEYICEIPWSYPEILERFYRTEICFLLLIWPHSHSQAVEF